MLVISAWIILQQTRDIDENAALKIMANVASMKHQIKEGIKSIVGEKRGKFIRDLIKK